MKILIKGIRDTEQNLSPPTQTRFFLPSQKNIYDCDKRRSDKFVDKRKGEQKGDEGKRRSPTPRITKEGRSWRG